MLRSAWFIARKDMRYMLRQRETTLWLFVMPIVFFYFIGTITGGVGGGGDDAKPTIALDAPDDAGFLTDQLVLRLEDQGYRIVRLRDEPEPAEYRRRLVVPENFTARALAGETSKLRFVRRGSGLGADYDGMRVSRATYSVLADLVVAAARDDGPGPEEFARLNQAPRPLSLRVVPAGTRKEIPRGFSQAVPGTMVMFTLLVLLTSGASLLVLERREGLLRRLAYTPIPRSSVVLGKWIGKLTLGLVQIAFAMIAGSLLFGVDWGPRLPMVAVVLLAYAGLTASLGILLGSLARTEGQAVGLGVLASMVLGAVGGCWWPIEVTPEWMQRLAGVVPTGWTMDALHRLMSFGAPSAEVVPHVAVLAVSALVAGWLSVRAFRYE